MNWVEADRRRVVHRGASALVLSLALVAGLFLQYLPEIRSGLSVAGGAPGDDQLCNWILEHDFRWLRGDRAHARLWSPPQFFPEANVAAYSEILLGIAPLYSGLRLVGFDRVRAFAGLLLLLAAMNFISFFLLSNRLLGFPFGASIAGAFLFAFSGPRSAQLNHMQVIAGFFVVSCVASLIAAFEHRRGNRWWIASFWLSLVLQAYAGVYISWFFGVLLAIATGVALLRGASRARLLGVLRRDRRLWIAGAVLTAVALCPLAIHYGAAAHLLGGRSYEEVRPLLPRWESWLHSGPGNLLYGKHLGRYLAQRLPAEWEHRLGLGAATWAFVVAGGVVAIRRRIEPTRTLLLVFAVALVVAMCWPGGYSLWRFVHDLIPGASAIRAVTRIAIVGLLPLALCAAVAWQRLAASRRGRFLLIPVAAVLVLEQVQFGARYSVDAFAARTSELARRIPGDCPTFYYSSTNPRASHIQVHLEAMWAGLERDIPTLNGYTGNLPPGWLLNDAVERTSAHPHALRVAQAAWMERKQMSTPVCWIRWDGELDHSARVERVSVSQGR